MQLRLCTYPDIHWVGLCCGDVVHDLVRGEEPKRVGEVLEVLYHTEDVRQVLGVIGCPRLSAVDTLALQRRIDVEDHVDAGGVEDGRTCRVIKGGVDVVNSNGVDLREDLVTTLTSARKTFQDHCTYTEPLYQGGIPQTDVRICKHIALLSGIVQCLASRLIVDANDHQPLACDCVDEVLAANFDWVDSMCNGDREGQ